MSLGESAVLRISSNCGYGTMGSPPTIPGGADLIFQVQLLAINGLHAGQQQVSHPATTFVTASRVPTTINLAASGFGNSNAANFATTANIVAQIPTQTVLPASVPQPTQTTSVESGEADSVHPPGALPECDADSCGKAIGWSKKVFGPPVCLCNPLCQTMKSTVGVLPCCPKLQEVCLNPWLSPSDRTNIAASTGRTPTVPQQAQTAPQQPQLVVQVSHPAVQPGTQSAPQLTSLHLSLAQQPATLAQQPATQTVAASQVAETVVTMQQPHQTTSQTPCANGNIKWAAQKSCTTKRYSIRDNKCRKGCNASNPALEITYWPSTAAGKTACLKTLALCPSMTR